MGTINMAPDRWLRRGGCNPPAGRLHRLLQKTENVQIRRGDANTRKGVEELSERLRGAGGSKTSKIHALRQVESSRGSV